MAKEELGPVCGYCGCFKSAHEDYEGTLYCPPHGATFTETPDEGEVNRIYDALPKGRGGTPHYSLSAIRAILSTAASLRSNHSKGDQPSLGDRVAKLERVQRDHLYGPKRKH